MKTQYQDSWDAAEAVFWEKFIALNTLEKRKVLKSMTLNDLNFHLKKSEKKNKLNPQKAEGRN